MYFPKSQIKTNLYTNGEEFELKGTKTSYIGDYYSISSGKYYTGKNPNDGRNRELIPINKNNKTPNQINEQNYVDLDNISDRSSLEVQVNLVNENDPGQLEADNTLELPEGTNYDLYQNNNKIFYKLKQPKPRSIPFPQITNPTNEDITKGFYIKYYVRDIINSSYYEISKETYKGMKSSDDYANDLYQSVAVKLSTKDRDKGLNNIRLLSIEQSLNWKGFLQFAAVKGKKRYSYTNGGEFTYLNRTNYIGYYHTMPNGTVMSGKYHGGGKDVILIPLKPLINPNSSTNGSPTESTSGGGEGGY